MAKNVTIKLDEELLILCRHEAVEQDKSLSQWMADALAERVRDIDAYRMARERAKERRRGIFTSQPRTEDLNAGERY